jgi:hypothetical protein
MDAPSPSETPRELSSDSQANKTPRLPHPGSCNPRLSIVVRQHLPTRMGSGCVPKLEVGHLVIAWLCRRHQNAARLAASHCRRHAAHQNQCYQDSHGQDPDPALHNLTSYSPCLWHDVRTYDSRPQASEVLSSNDTGSGYQE